jgi:Histidine kinase-like ATPase domain
VTIAPVTITSLSSNVEPFGPFCQRARSAIIISVREPPAQLEISDISRELDHSGRSSPHPGLDLQLYEDKFPTFGRHAAWSRKPANSLLDLIGRPNAVPTPMIKREPHKRKNTRAVQWLAASFEPTPRSIREARKFFGSVITQPGMRETGELLVSELTTNALRHATGPFEVRVRALPRVRVEVRDSARCLPLVKDLGTAEEGGRGLQIVGQLARSWGTEELADGKVVWFEL